MTYRGSYTEEDNAKLRKLWAEGLSASQIAAQFSGRFSRNAIIGKVHRLGLPGRAKGQRAPNDKARNTKPKASVPSIPRVSRPAAPHPAPPDRIVAASSSQPEKAPARELSMVQPLPESLRLPLHHLTDNTCKWPQGDPFAEDFHFCGCDTGGEPPYCTYHARLAYQPAVARRSIRIPANA